MLEVVSVSLGSSSRNKTTTTSLLGEELTLSRIGTDGDLKAARELIARLDGAVAAIGLGGIDQFLCAAGRKYQIRDARWLASAARQTPVVDGSELKLTLERQVVDQLAAGFEGPPLQQAKVLHVSAVDRWGMAEGLNEHAAQVVYGDLLFGLGIPIRLNSLRSVARVARLVAPIVVRLPFSLLYPTGKKQREHRPRYPELFEWADWISGDFHYIRRNLPPRLDRKVILTNTTTAEDQALLKERGLSWLVTTTPVIDGRSFGMNVLEGCLAALMQQNGVSITSDNYLVYLNKLKLKPIVLLFN